MSSVYDWGLVVAILTHHPNGLTQGALVDELMNVYQWSRERALAAIAAAIERGWVMEDDGRLKVAAEPSARPTPPMDLGF